MAIIVQMPSPRPRSEDHVTVAAGATILFFTGVRYERDLDGDDEIPECRIGVEIMPTIDPASIVAVL